MLVELLSEIDSRDGASAFYDRVCEAVCRLTSMERAALLLYDSSREAVRAVGAHGVDHELLAGVEATLEETPIAQRALSEDRVLETSGDLEREVPPRYARFAGITTLTCIPVSAAGRWLGVMIADRGGGGTFELTEDERHRMHTLGRLAALAAGVEGATREQERARRLSERIALTRELHESVMQRLFGLSLALGAEQPLPAEELHRCHTELREALKEMRAALDRSLAARYEETTTTLREALEHLGHRRPELVVSWPREPALPGSLEPLTQSVLREAVRNADKHASPSRVEVSIGADAESFRMEVINDGAGPGGRGAGMGLKLLSLEAVQAGGILEFGPLESDRWHVRLVVPREGR